MVFREAWEAWDVAVAVVEVVEVVVTLEVLWDAGFWPVDWPWV